MFDDVLLAQSAVDRFKNAAYDFVIEGESYRARLKPSSMMQTHHRHHPPQRRGPTLALALGGAADPHSRSDVGTGRMLLQKSDAATRVNPCEQSIRRRVRIEAPSALVVQPVPWRHHPAKQVAAWGCKVAVSKLLSRSALPATRTSHAPARGHSRLGQGPLAIGLQHVAPI